MLYELAGDWCARGKDTGGERRARIAAAEAFVSVAAMRADAEPGPAAMNLQAGIEAYRPDVNHQPPNPSPMHSATISATIASRGLNSQRCRNGSRPPEYRPPSLFLSIF